MSNSIGLTGAIAGVLTSGVALAAILIPDLTQAAQVAIIAFGNSLITVGAVLYQLRVGTLRAAPVVAPGTEVEVITPKGLPNYTTTV